MIPFIDLDAQHAPIREAIDEAIASVVDSGQFIGGPHVDDFERRVADYVGVDHAIGVSSGSDALLASLMALGVGAGDEVVTTPFTFCASAECILRVGATPVFVDIDPATFNLDAGLIEEAITDRTRAILAVHLFGQCCQMNQIVDLAGRHDLRVVEDCAQAMGARFGSGPMSDQQAGSMGDVGCFSFFPTKNLGGIGDGGMITCDDDALAERIRAICAHGCPSKDDQHMVGGNFRLDAIQAAVLGVKMDCLDGWIDARRQNAAHYDAALADVDGLVTPAEADRCWHTYNQYTVRAADRPAVCVRLEAADIGYGVYYPKSLHDQPAYDGVTCVTPELRATRQAAQEVVSLPVAAPTADDVAEVCRAVKGDPARYQSGRAMK